MLANLPMLTNSTHYAFISARYAHIMHPNRITGQENNYSNYLTFIIKKVLQHQGKFNVYSP